MTPEEYSELVKQKAHQARLKMDAMWKAEEAKAKAEAEAKAKAEAEAKAKESAIKKS